ncbi:uncharacterized protein CCOS01_06168, partial [Colletotrichum costaricense]
QAHACSSLSELQFSHVNGLEPAVIFFLSYFQPTAQAPHSFSLMSRARPSSLCPPSLSSLFSLSRLITTKPFYSFAALIAAVATQENGLPPEVYVVGIRTPNQIRDSLFRLSVACVQVVCCCLWPVRIRGSVRRRPKNSKIGLGLIDWG